MTIRTSNNIALFDNADLRIRVSLTIRLNISWYEIQISSIGQLPFLTSFVHQSDLDSIYEFLYFAYNGGVPVMDQSVTSDMFKEALTRIHNVFLPEYNWALQYDSGEWKAFTRSKHDRLATTAQEIEAVHAYASGNRGKYAMLK